MKITEIAHRKRVTKIENQLAGNKAIVAKRNRLISDALDNFADPVWVGKLVYVLFNFITAEFQSNFYQHKPSLIDYFMLLELRQYMTFTIDNVSMAYDTIPKELFSTTHPQNLTPRVRVERMVRLNFVRQAMVNKQRTYVVTPQGKMFLIGVMEKFREILLITIKEPAVKRRRK